MNLFVRHIAGFVAGTALSLSCTIAAAQEATSPPSLQKTDAFAAAPLLSSQEFFLALAVLGFGAFVVVIEFLLLKKTRTTADEILRILTVTLIIVISLTLVASGYGNEQITPVLGLFGTIVGYLLGSTRGHAPEGDRSPPHQRRDPEEPR